MKLPASAPPLRFRQRADLAGAWERVTPGSAGASLPEGLDPAHLHAVESALTPRRDEVAGRVDIGWLQSAAVAVPDDPGRVFHVFPGRDGPEVVPIRSGNRSLRVAAVVAGVVVLVLLMVALV
ncbi:hypothetical protein ACIRP2_31940 [Streptomyces sp. NPDC101194]|uniref:hypothetical protein n=1 Tax=Streptomyces sp. NPDC101194 TaxID=3366127 RepID=UPI0038074889